MFKYRLVVDQVMKPKDWVMLAVLVVFTAGSLYLVWQEFQEPIVFYEVGNIEDDVWQTENTEQGTVVRNLNAGYEVVVPDGWDISHQEGILRMHNDFNMAVVPTEAPTGCILSINADQSSYSNVSEWIVEYDNQRNIIESDEFSRTVISNEEVLKINNLELLVRTYEPPIGPIYREYYTYQDGRVFIIRQVVGVVGDNLNFCNTDFGLMINSFKAF